MIINSRAKNFFSSLAENSVSLTVTSPPYDDLRDYGGEKWDNSIFKEIADELYRVTKVGRVVA